VVLWIAFVGRRVFGGRAVCRALPREQPLWIAMGRFLTLDMGFSAFPALSIGAFLVAQRDRRRVPAWMPCPGDRARS
jgi:hypothetical protein